LESVGFNTSHVGIKQTLIQESFLLAMIAPLNILVLEDHDALREVLTHYIELAGHKVWAADCAQCLDDHMVDYHFDVLILDINLPGEDGLSVAKRVRKAHPNLFIIMVSVRASLADKVAGYENGADIYLPKPIEHEELLAAIASVSRRIRHNHVQASAHLDVKGMSLKLAQLINLSRDEVALLRALIEADQHKLPHYRLLEVIDKQVTPSAKANLEVAIGRLRRKMAKAGI